MSRFTSKPASRAELAALLAEIDVIEHPVNGGLVDYHRRGLLVSEGILVAQHLGLTAGYGYDAQPYDPSGRDLNGLRIVGYAGGGDRDPLAQVSWHMRQYPLRWDGITGEKRERIRAFVAKVAAGGGA